MRIPRKSTRRWSRIKRSCCSDVIYDDGCVGEVYRQSYILNPGKQYYVITMNEGPRGPLRVLDCAHIRDEAWVRLLTRPNY